MKEILNDICMILFMLIGSIFMTCQFLYWFYNIDYEYDVLKAAFYFVTGIMSIFHCINCQFILIKDVCELRSKKDDANND